MLQHKIGDKVHLSGDYYGEIGTIVGETINLLGMHLWTVQLDGTDRKPSFYDHEVKKRFAGRFADSLAFGMQYEYQYGHGNAADITFVSNVAIEDYDTLERVLGRYLDTYWRTCPAAGPATIKAWREKRILMPKMHGFATPMGPEKRGLYDNFEAYREAVASNEAWTKGWCPRDCRVTRDEVLAAKDPIELYQLFPFRD